MLTVLNALHIPPYFLKLTRNNEKMLSITVSRVNNEYCQRFRQKLIGENFRCKAVFIIYYAEQAPCLTSEPGDM